MASSAQSPGRLPEDDLRNLASKVGSPDVNLVAYVLGLPRRHLEKIREESKGDAEESSCKIMLWWRETHEKETDSRQKLAGILKKIGRQDLCRILLRVKEENVEGVAVHEVLASHTMNYAKSPPLIKGEKVTQTVKEEYIVANAVQAIRVAPTMKQGEYMPLIKEEESIQAVPEAVKPNLSFADQTLAAIAENIPDAKLDLLGIQLGFSQAKISNFVTTNRLSGKVEFTGTREMLITWRNATRVETQRAGLGKALTQAGLEHVANTFCGSNLPADVTSQKSASFIPDDWIKAIKNHYKTFLCKIQRRPWDPTDFTVLSDLFTEIRLFKYETGEWCKIPFDGKVEDILTFKVDEQSPKRIILSAPGGHGKTCVIAKLAYDWAYEVQSSPIRHIPVLFALKLREVSETMGLGDAISSQILGDIPEATPERIEELIRQHQDQCALLCDGYDEYANRISTAKKQNSLVQALGFKKFMNCTVLVTSRPFLEDDFIAGSLAKVYTKVEIEGFTQEYAHDYIHKYFSAKQKLGCDTKLISILEKNSFLKDLIRVPLFCIMVCHLYELKSLSNAGRLTSLFEEINQFLWENARTVRKEEVPSHVDVDHVLRTLGKVALDGLLSGSKKLVFNIQDFKGFEPEYKVGTTLGLLSETSIPLKHLRRKETNTTVEFFHPLQQEYSASMYLAHELPTTSMFGTFLDDCSGECVTSQKPKSPHDRMTNRDQIDNPRDSGPRSPSIFTKARKRLSRTFSFGEANNLFPKSKSEPALAQSQTLLQKHLGRMDTARKVMENENILRFVAGVSCSACNEILAHIATLDWNFLHVQDKCRLVLNCLAEVDKEKIDEIMASALEKSFMDGKLKLDRLTESMITGLERLPQNVKSKITEGTFNNLPQRIWMCLPQFDNMETLKFTDISSKPSVDEAIQPLKSVTKFEAWQTGHDVVDFVCEYLSSVKDIDVCMSDDVSSPAEEISSITKSIRKTKETLESISIRRRPVAMEKVSRVSCQAIQDFGQLIQYRLTHLTRIALRYIRLEESAIIDIVKCSQLSTCIKRIEIWWCGSRSDGELHRFLNSIGIEYSEFIAGSSISVVVLHGTRKKEGAENYWWIPAARVTYV